MDYLFSLKPNQTISEAIKSLSKFQLSGLSYGTIVKRGYEYFNAGAVYPNVEISIGKYELEVSGSYGEYEVVIEQQQEKIYGFCDCPYDDTVCKHLIATLLHLQNHVETHRLQEADITKATLAKVEKAKSDFEQYVNDLPIEELRKLVLDFAPEYFRKEIIVKQNVEKGDTKKVEKSFSNAIININNLFDSELYDINNFIKDTNKALAKLRPFWKTFSMKVTAELINFIENVNEAFDEGQLYDDYGDYSYEGEDFSTYVAEFIASLSNVQRKDAIPILLEAKENLDYSCFENMASDIAAAIPTSDLPNFAILALELEYTHYLKGRQALIFYERIQPYLFDNQKEQVLKEQSNDAYSNLALAKYYESKLNYTAAYSTLEKDLEEFENPYFNFRSTSIRDEQFQKIIQLCDEKLVEKNTSDWIEKYIEKIPSAAAFQTAIKYRPENRSAFESYFEQHHVTVFVEILETENRLSQVVELFKTHQNEFANTSIIYSFYQQHKFLFPKEARLIFIAALESYSEAAKRTHYEKMAEILNELKPILTKNEFRAIVMGIQSKYFRRSSLMEILKEKGFL